MKLRSAPFSYRDDPAVPAFDDAGVLAVMDAECGLCARGVRWIAHHDGRAEFGIMPLQSTLGAELIRHYGMDPEDPLSWLYLEEGRGYTSLDAVIRVGWRLGGIWRGLVMLRVLPRPVQDRLYGLVARNRYRLTRRASFCEMPDAEIRRRLIR